MIKLSYKKCLSIFGSAYNVESIKKDKVPPRLEKFEIYGGVIKGSNYEDKKLVFNNKNDLFEPQFDEFKDIFSRLGNLIIKSDFLNTNDVSVVLDHILYTLMSFLVFSVDNLKYSKFYISIFYPKSNLGVFLMFDLKHNDMMISVDIDIKRGEFKSNCLAIESNEIRIVEQIKQATETGMPMFGNILGSVYLSPQWFSETCVKIIKKEELL